MAIICERLCRGMFLNSFTLFFLAHTFSNYFAQAEPFYPKCIEETGGQKLSDLVPKCIIHCPGEIKPVCGTDGAPYHNACFLCRSACTNPSLHIACDGDCPCDTSAAYSKESAKFKGTKTTTITNHTDGTEKVIVEDMDDHLKKKVEKEKLKNTDGTEKVVTDQEMADYLKKKAEMEKLKNEARKKYGTAKKNENANIPSRGPKDKKRKVSKKKSEL